MPIEKRYISENKVCKATFVLPKGTAAQAITVVGDFNGWDRQATPMTQLKSGVWKAQVKLDAGRAYQYRYLLDGREWRNDPQADRYVPNEYGEENSVVEV